MVYRKYECYSDGGLGWVCSQPIHMGDQVKPSLSVLWKKLEIVSVSRDLVFPQSENLSLTGAICFSEACKRRRNGSKLKWITHIKNSVLPLQQHTYEMPLLVKMSQRAYGQMWGRLYEGSTCRSPLFYQTPHKWNWPMVYQNERADTIMVAVMVRESITCENRTTKCIFLNLHKESNHKINRKGKINLQVSYKDIFTVHCNSCMINTATIRLIYVLVDVIAWQRS